MRKLRPDTPVIILLDRHELSLEIQVIEGRAYDVLVKPLEPTLFCLAVARALEVFQLRSVARWQEAELIAAFDAVLKDLEELYRAYGLHAHFEALISRRKA
jgi:DNA-binding NtrC family response regulator